MARLTRARDHPRSLIFVPPSADWCSALRVSPGHRTVRKLSNVDLPIRETPGKSEIVRSSAAREGARRGASTTLVLWLEDCSEVGSDYRKRPREKPTCARPHPSDTL